jgi:hypothetical protein
VVDCQAPTIQQSLASAQVMAGAGVAGNWMVPLAGFGVVVCVHDEPFQLSTTTCSPALELSTPDTPTAQQLDVETQVTELRLALETPRLGSDDWDHHVPFQCRARGAVAVVVDDVAPTAQQSEAETHVTELAKTDTSGENRLPRDPNAQPGPGAAVLTVRFWTDEVLVAYRVSPV